MVRRARSMFSCEQLCTPIVMKMATDSYVSDNRRSGRRCVSRQSLRLMGEMLPVRSFCRSLLSSVLHKLNRAHLSFNVHSCSLRFVLRGRARDRRANL